MKTLVIYDSGFGNTEKIAKTIGEAVDGDVSVKHLKGLTPSTLQNVDMLFIGSPTQGGKPTKAFLEFFKSIPDSSLKGLPAVAFDTRLSAKWLGVIGYAAGKIAKMMTSKGAVLLVPPEGFFVEGKEGPLKEGEVTRTARWTQQVLENLAISAP